MVKANVKNYYVQYSDLNISNGAKGGSRKYYSNGHYHRINNGWDYDYTPLKMIVECELVNGEVVETWVDRFFKNELGRLTTRRKEVIENNCPKTLYLEEHDGWNGKYYTVCDDDLGLWLHKVKTQLEIV